MKFALALLAVVAVVTPLNAFKLPAVGDGALAKELQDIVDLIPINDVLAIMKVYLAKDKQFQDLVSLAQSPESQQLIKDVEARSELKQILRFLQKRGLDVFYLVNKLNEAMNIPLISPMADEDMEITGGVQGFVTDVARAIPLSKIIDLLGYKLQHSQLIKDVVHELTKPEYLNFYASVILNVHFVTLEKQAVRLGLNEDSFRTYYPIILSVATIKHYIH